MATHSRWLLMLGSNRLDDVAMRMAVKRLDELGTVKRLTPICRLPSDDDSPGPYFNALVELAADLDRAALNDRLKVIELELGRRHGEPGHVEIDIDLLALAEQKHWRADAHASNKGSFKRKAVIELLHQAHIPDQSIVG